MTLCGKRSYSIKKQKSVLEVDAEVRAEEILVVEGYDLYEAIDSKGCSPHRQKRH